MSSKMQAWLAIPHDPLVFRDGKPFTATPGARATSVPFPFPSTLAGAVRTLSGALNNGGVFPASNQEVIEQVLGYRIVGPFLFDLKRNEVLFPAPQDAGLLKLDPHDKQKAQRIVLSPTSCFEEAKVLTNLPSGLRLVAPTGKSKTKRHPDAPPFWYWDKIKAWLCAPQVGEVDLNKLGIRALPVDYRMHVSIQSETGTAEEGALFQTAGLTFVHTPSSATLSDTADLGLVVQTNAPLKKSPGTLGGERRLAMWKPVGEAIPACPDEVRDSICTTRRGRFVLATPGHFQHGFLPTWVCGQRPGGVTLRIVGAAVGRPVHVSGWDYDKRAPKPTRRLAPVGSVYFFEITDGDKAAIDRFIEEIWLSPISDNEQDRRDGFGVALLGIWNEKEAQNAK